MNVKGEVKGDLLVLTINIGQAAKDAAQPSSTGKTRVVATTSGYTGFGDVKVSLNATIPLNG